VAPRPFGSCYGPTCYIITGKLLPAYLKDSDPDSIWCHGVWFPASAWNEDNVAVWWSLTPRQIRTTENIANELRRMKSALPPARHGEIDDAVSALEWIDFETAHRIVKGLADDFPRPPQDIPFLPSLKLRDLRRWTSPLGEHPERALVALKLNTITKQIRMMAWELRSTRALAQAAGGNSFANRVVNIGGNEHGTMRSDT